MNAILVSTFQHFCFFILHPICCAINILFLGSTTVIDCHRACMMQCIIDLQFTVTVAFPIIIVSKTNS